MAILPHFELPNTRFWWKMSTYLFKLSNLVHRHQNHSLSDKYNSDINVSQTYASDCKPVQAISVLVLSLWIPWLDKKVPLASKGAQWTHPQARQPLVKCRFPTQLHYWDWKNRNQNNFHSFKIITKYGRLVSFWVSWYQIMMKKMNSPF